MMIIIICKVPYRIAFLPNYASSINNCFWWSDFLVIVASFSLSFSLVGLAGNLLMPIFGRLNILATIVLVLKNETPCTTNSIIFELNRLMDNRNLFTNGQIRLNCMLSKPKPLTFRAHFIFLPTIHCWNFFISEKMIFFLIKIIIIIFIFFLSSHSIFGANWLPPSFDFKLSFLFIFSTISILMLPFIFTNKKIV